MGVNTHPDLAGRPPKYGSLKEAMNQGVGTKKPHDDTLQAELNQPGGKRGNGGKISTLGSTMGQK